MHVEDVGRALQAALAFKVSALAASVILPSTVPPINLVRDRLVLAAVLAFKGSLVQTLLELLHTRPAKLPVVRDAVLVHVLPTALACRAMLPALGTHLATRGAAPEHGSGTDGATDTAAGNVVLVVVAAALAR